MSDSAGTTFTEVKEIEGICSEGILPETRLATPLSAPLLLVSNFKLKAVCAALDTGFASSAVLSTLDKPTFDLLIPEVFYCCLSLHWRYQLWLLSRLKSYQ
jgi:hypothetical protein